MLDCSSLCMHVTVTYCFMLCACCLRSYCRLMIKLEQICNGRWFVCLWKVKFRRVHSVWHWYLFFTFVFEIVFTKFNSILKYFSIVMKLIASLSNVVEQFHISIHNSSLTSKMYLYAEKVKLKCPNSCSWSMCYDPLWTINSASGSYDSWVVLLIITLFFLAVPLPVLADWFLPVWDIGNCVGIHMVTVL